MSAARLAPQWVRGDGETMVESSAGGQVSVDG